jgi:phosphate-selective porin OprO and OprP
VRTIRILALIAGITVLSATVSLASEVDGLLDLLVKKGIVTQDEASGLRHELDTQRKTEAAKKKDSTVSAKRPIRMSGYVQFRGTSAQDDNDAFLIRRARLNLAADIAPRWSYLTVLDFGNAASKSVSSIDFKKGTSKTGLTQKPVMLDAQIDYAVNSADRLSFGQFKVPFSYESLRSDADLDTINRAQVVEKLVPGRDLGAQGRDLGIQYGGARQQLEYAVGVFNGAGINTGDDNDRKDIAARLVAHLSKPLAVGVSYYDGGLGSEPQDHKRVGGEVICRSGPWSLTGEYISGKDGSVMKSGWYTHAGYRFAPLWEGVVRFDRFDPDLDASDDRSEVLTLGANHFITDTVKLQINYERKREEADQKRNDALLAQLQVKF